MFVEIVFSFNLRLSCFVKIELAYASAIVTFTVCLIEKAKFVLK